MPGPVFIAGMGRRGRAVADALTEFGIGYAAMERDERRLREAVADGYMVAFGDVGDPRLWDAVSMGERHIAVITAPSLERFRAKLVAGRGDRFRHQSFGVSGDTDQPKPKLRSFARHEHCRAFPRPGRRHVARRRSPVLRWTGGEQ